LAAGSEIDRQDEQEVAKQDNSLFLRCNRGHRLRANTLAVVLSFCFCALGARLYYLQRIRYDDYSAHAQRQQVTTRTIPGHRGTILDCRGRVLAQSIPRWSVYLDPMGVDGFEQTAYALAQHLGLDDGEIYEDLLKNSTRRFLYLKHRNKRLRLDRKGWQDLKALELAGVHAVEEDERVYPNARLGSHVLGLTDIDGKGLEGIEMVMNDVLRGRPGRVTLKRDARGRRLLDSGFASSAPVHGKDVMLTLDTVIQYIAEEELQAVMARHAPVSALCVVMDPLTGDVLAMANRPAFDADQRSGPISDRRNRAVTDIYEPGSTFKPLVMAAALEWDVVQPSTRIFCQNGIYKVFGRKLHDHHPYGSLTISQVVIKSSNIGMAKVGIMMGPEKLQRCLSLFGFGSATNIRLPGEQAGMVTPPAKWNGYSTTSVPMGQEIAVTPIQMCAAFSAIGNGGVFFSPGIIKGVIREDSELNETGFTHASKRILSPEVTLGAMSDMLQRVVTEGTGKRAAQADYRIMGKTGTAQKVIDGRYSHDKYIASFVGLAPAEQVRLVTIVVVDEPTQNGYYGGQVAAGAVGRILARSLEYLGVPSDREREINVATTP